MSDDSCHGCSWYGSLCQGQGAWPHAWMHWAVPGARRLTSTGGRRWGKPAWLAVLRADSKKQGHRAMTPQWCLLKTQGGEGARMGLVRVDPPELPRLE